MRIGAPIDREKLPADDFCQADTVSLMRARACTLRAKYEKMRRFHEDYATHKLNLKSPEGNGSGSEQILELRRTNLLHERCLYSTFAKMERDAAAMQRCN